MNVVVPSERVASLAAAGRKIEAIKLLREEEGLGLMEAKDIVDGLAADASRPLPPAAGREDRGVLRLVAVLAVLAAIVVLLSFS